MKKYKTTVNISTTHGELPMGTESISSEENEVTFDFFGANITFIIDDTNDYLFEEIK